jgi:hypothetical protein
MKRSAFFASLVAVFFLAFFFSRKGKEGSGSEPETERALRAESDRTSGGLVGVPARGDFRDLGADEFQKAWDAIPGRKLKRRDRVKLQQEVLKEWAKRDLKAAAKAAFAEAWDDPYPGAGGSLEQFLAIAFREVFQSRTHEVWEMIVGDEFGRLESALMRTAWATALMREDAKKLLPYLADLDRGNQQKAISSLLAKKDEGILAEIWASLDGLEAPASLGPVLAMKTSEEFSRDEILALVEKGGAVGKMAVESLVKKISTGPATAESLTVAETLPEEVRSDYVYALMRGESSDPEFAKRGIEMLMEAEEWQMLSNKDVSEKVRLIAAETPPEDLAAWAVALPQREEAARLFHRGVEPYIQSQPDEAWNWIGQFEEGMWRDRAYAEFSQQALHHFNDPARSEAALNRISDPAFQRKAWSWRRGWENRTGYRK